jgi:hypothetical protein
MVMVEDDSDRCPSMSSLAGPLVGGCPGLKAGEEEKEVELIFAQLWHIPPNLNKPVRRRESDIKATMPTRVHHSSPLPPLTPE